MILRLLLVVILSLVAAYTGVQGLERLGEMRAMERVPQIQVAEVTGGTVKLQGRALVSHGTLTAPSSGLPALYYRHVEERRVRDHEGNTRWETVSDTRQGMDFDLEDDTGLIGVMFTSAARYSAPRKFSQTRGDRRYTEYRIDPGDTVTVLGRVVSRGDITVLVLSRLPGNHAARVSAFGDAHERASLARSTLIHIWLFLAAVAVIIVTVCRMFRIHKVVVFLSLLTGTTLLSLLGWSIAAAKIDLQVALEQHQSASEATAQVIQARLASHGLVWNGRWATLEEMITGHGGLPRDEADHLLRLHINVVRATERIRATWERWPEAPVAAWLDLHAPESIPLSQDARRSMEFAESGFEPSRLQGASPWLVILPGVAGTLFLLPFGLSLVQLKRTIENIPTSPSAGVTYGLTELKGEIVSMPGEFPLTSPIQGKPCVYYHYTLEEKRSVGTKNEKWVTIKEERIGRRFLCRDREGDFPIDPQGAEVITQTTFQRLQRSRDPGESSAGKGPYRHTEHRLDEGDTLYALGRARIDPETQRSLYLAEGEQPFILSNLTEHQVMLRKANAGFMSITAGFIAALGTLLAVIGLMGAFSGLALLIAAMTAPFYMIIAVIVLMYNDLVFLRNRVNTTWSNIGVSLQKRADLIPAMEATVKASMAHERELLERLTELRTRVGVGADYDVLQAEGLLRVEQRLLAQLRLLQESYPDLDTSGDLAQFHDTLVRLENEVALMRDGFNHAVERYNTRAAHVPEIILAKVFGFRPAQFFRTEVEVVAPDLSSLVPSSK
ncbi:LemA family protein [Ectothiorhodospira shaposhnikovii]|uniref:LemA family protein n=1 Tax=Ectothiorhodospira shaposhnikovii TaxID=1054 RepID=UPI0019055B83